MTYLALRHLHITCVLLSVLLFVWRAGWALAGVNWRQRWPWLRWLPHALDTVLLSAGVGLMVWSAQYPDTQHPWLALKLMLLLAYIGCGKQALRPQMARPRRLAWGVAALACVAGMVGLALTRWPG